MNWKRIVLIVVGVIIVVNVALTLLLVPMSQGKDEITYDPGTTGITGNGPTTTTP